MRERTIYDWFDRMEDEPPEVAIHDDPRPGRPSKLADDQPATFEAALEDAPADHGIDAPVWTPEIARTYIRGSSAWSTPGGTSSACSTTRESRGSDHDGSRRQPVGVVARPPYI